MNLFPYNKNKEEKYIGTPLAEQELYKIASSVFIWHCHCGTLGWRQSINAKKFMNQVTKGLAVVFSEPAFIEMLENIGVACGDRIETFLQSEKDYRVKEYAGVAQAIKEFKGGE